MSSQTSKHEAAAARACLERAHVQTDTRKADRAVEEAKVHALLALTSVLERALEVRVFMHGGPVER